MDAEIRKRIIQETPIDELIQAIKEGGYMGAIRKWAGRINDMIVLAQEMSPGDIIEVIDCTPHRQAISEWYQVVDDRDE